MSALTDTLLRGANDLGVLLPEGSAASFATYYDVLSAENAHMDLTAVSGEMETAERHFLDSLSLLRCADFSGKRVIDVGSGAGFPGLPLKLAVPSVSLTLLDAQQKRVEFLRRLCEHLGVEAVCLHARAEEQALQSGWRDSFDFAVSRAVARLSLLCELCLPFVRPGGALLAMKAADSSEEIAEAARAIKTLGGRLLRVDAFPVGGIPRSVVVIEKTSPTPVGYPRRFSRIQKKPL